MGDYTTKRTNQMDTTQPTTRPPEQKTYRDYRDNPPQSGPGVAPQGPISQAIGWDPNRGDPNVRKAAKLVVEEPKAPAAAPAAPATPAGPTPAQIAATQAAAIAAQQAAFWAQHAASQRMKEERARQNSGG